MWGQLISEKSKSFLSFSNILANSPEKVTSAHAGAYIQKVKGHLEDTSTDELW